MRAAPGPVRVLSGPGSMLAEMAGQVGLAAAATGALRSGAALRYYRVGPSRQRARPGQGWAAASRMARFTVAAKFVAQGPWPTRTNGAASITCNSAGSVM